MDISQTLYVSYAVLLTMTLIAGATWQITGSKKSGSVAKILFFASTLPFLTIYYMAAVTYLSVREFPHFLKDSFIGVVVNPVNPNIPLPKSKGKKINSNF